MPPPLASRTLDEPPPGSDMQGALKLAEKLLAAWPTRKHWENHCRTVAAAAAAASAAAQAIVAVRSGDDEVVEIFEKGFPQII